MDGGAFAVVATAHNRCYTHLLIHHSENGDCFAFADGVVARIAEGKLQGVAKGTTYVQKRISEMDCIVAYKVLIE